MKSYFIRHAQVLFYVLGQLARTPVASAMTILVIGITLALPGGLYLVIDNIQRVATGWDGGAQVSLFLKHKTSSDQSKRLANKLRRLPEIKAVQLITPAEALEEFKTQSGFGDALDALDHNPLPPVLILTPAPDASDATSLETLMNHLKIYREIDLAQLDLEWVKRLNQILLLAQRGVILLAAILGLAVLLTVGNTIRLAILNRRDEIEITKLIGGTDAFIRRPFLYNGMLQGLFGALTAWLLIHGSLLVLQAPVSRLAHLYSSQFGVAGLGFQNSLILLVTGASLGWAGSRLAVGRHLREIEPR